MYDSIFRKDYKYKKKGGKFWVKPSGKNTEWIEVSKEIYTIISWDVERIRMDARRNRKRNLSLEYKYANGLTLEDCISSPISGENFYKKAFLNECLEKIRKLLTDEELELFNAVIVQGYSVKEYADSIGQPRTTVQSRKEKILKKIKKI